MRAAPPSVTAFVDHRVSETDRRMPAKCTVGRVVHSPAAHRVIAVAIATFGPRQTATARLTAESRLIGPSQAETIVHTCPAAPGQESAAEGANPSTRS